MATDPPAPDLPVGVNAQQYDGSRESVLAIMHWAGVGKVRNHGGILQVETADGMAEAHPGDWVIRQPDGTLIVGRRVDTMAHNPTTVLYACANCEYRWHATELAVIDLIGAHCPACGIRRALQPNVYRPVVWLDR